MTINAKIRQQVQDRAGKRCEYCTRIEYRIGFSFHVDHIIPPLHNGTNDLDNLAWSCFHCNVFKGQNIASYDIETRDLTPLFNPRKDKWTEHFSKDELHINSKTPIGEVTVRVLQMNHPEQIEIRELLQKLNLW